MGKLYASCSVSCIMVSEVCVEKYIRYHYMLQIKAYKVQRCLSFPDILTIAKLLQIYSASGIAKNNCRET